MSYNDNHAPKAKIDHWDELENISNNPWECPRCGISLIVREGRHGKFLGCPNYPSCRYTRSLDSKFDNRVFCEKCNNTGLLPFIKPDGSISKFARVFCECREADHEYCPTPRPQDIDFACSYDFRSFFEEIANDSPLKPIEQVSVS